MTSTAPPTRFSHRPFLGCLVAFVVILLNAAGCGGGTSGSGLRSYAGTVRTNQGDPLQGAVITIEDTGESAHTDAEGRFAIASEAAGQNIAFLIESPRIASTFSLNDISHDSSNITLEIVVNLETDTAEVKDVRLKAQFVGRCDYYFENREVLRQANQVPEGTICSLNVEITASQGRIAGKALELQYSACHEGSQWNILSSTATGYGEHAGFAEINFEFRDSTEFCRYRVVTKDSKNNYPIGVYPIDTFTEQKYYESSSNQESKKKNSL